uniref:ATP-binding cassette domain-containing protein n=1 Tax=Streptococcus pneumoniae TaxID=1313 RepID=UPI0011542D00
MNRHPQNKTEFPFVQLKGNKQTLFLCPKSKSRVDNLLKRVGLYDSRKMVAGKLSTGMRQRMLLARALINKPAVLFLDE